MAEEATIQGVVTELQDVNQLLSAPDNPLLAPLIEIKGISEQISAQLGMLLQDPDMQKSLKKMTDNIVEGVADAVKGLTDSNEAAALEQNRDEAGQTTPSPSGKDGKSKSTFGKAFKTGREEDLGDMFGFKKIQQEIGNKIGNLFQLWDGITTGFNKTMDFLGSGFSKMGKMVKGLKSQARDLQRGMVILGGAVRQILRNMSSTIGDLAKDMVKRAASMFAGPMGKIMKVIKKGLTLLRVGMVSLFTGIASAISGLVSTLTAALTPLLGALAPFIAIAAVVAAGVTALVLGIKNMVADFQGQEGGLFDKILAGILGFFDGFMKILTIPIDWLINLTAKVLEFFGFDGAAKVLEDFSLTQLVDDMTDGILEFLLMIKDGIVGFAKDAWNGIKGFFGFGDDEDEVDSKELEKVKKVTDDERQLLEQIVEQREDGKRRMMEQGFSEEEATERAESGFFDPAKTRSASKQISTKEMKETIAANPAEKKYRYDVVDPATGELIDSAGSPEEAARIAMETGGVMEDPVETKGNDKAFQASAAAQTAEVLGRPVTQSKHPEGGYKTGTLKTRKSPTSGPLSSPASRSMGSAEKRGMSIPSSTSTNQVKIGGIVVQENGKPTKLTEKEAARVEEINQVRVAQGNVAYDLSQNEIVSSPTVSGGSNTMVSQSNELDSRTNDLSRTKNENNSSGGGSPVAVVDNSQQQSVVNNNSTSGVTPGPFDKSDRTHRRGAYRGRGI